MQNTLSDANKATAHLKDYRIALLGAYLRADVALESVAEADVSPDDRGHRVVPNDTQLEKVSPVSRVLLL